MKLEQQVCSLELAQKLKELGVKQESLFYWTDYQSATFDKGEFIQKFWVAGFNDPLEEDGATYYSAFTVAELGEMLPKELKIGEYIYDVEFYWSDKEWFISYAKYVDGIHREHEIYAETEADARAKMIVYLLENKLM